MAVISCQKGQKTSFESDNQAFEDPPMWASKAIWYQIFVERFRNGDPSNDPTKEDILGSYPGFIPDNWQITPWGQDWYKEDRYFEELEKGKDYYGNHVTSFNSKSQMRRYGGDLQGVLDQIDYLDSLGITAVYFNPLNDAPSLHKFDARNWRHVDRNFGPDPRGDVKIIAAEVPDDPSTWQFTSADQLFLKVVEQLHARGIKVILDYSFNHTGTEFWAWQDLLKNQSASKYKDWYWVKSFDDPTTEDSEFEYRGWAGVHDLPEIQETSYQEHSDRVVPVDGNIYAEEAKSHIFAVAKRWLDPNQDGDPGDGIDGYRLDVAAEMPFGFWRDFRKVVRGVNPDAYLLGEIWWEQWPDKLLDPEPFIRGDIFDSPMNYRWYKVARQFFNQAPESIKVSAFVDSLNHLHRGIRRQNNYAMMNMTASHDVPRVLTSLFNKNKYKYYASPSEGNPYKIDKPDADTYRTLKLLLSHQFTYIGAPQIWAGDEMGMWGADDPSCRKPLIWPDIEFEDEQTHPLGHDRQLDKVRFSRELFTFYQALIRIRRSNGVLADGEIEYFLIDDQSELLGYRRFNDKEEVVCLFNSGQVAQTATVKCKRNKYKNPLTANLIKADKGQMQIEVPSRSAVILVATN